MYSEAQHILAGRLRVLAESPTLEDTAETLGIEVSTRWRKRKRYKIISMPSPSAALADLSPALNLALTAEMRVLQ